MVSHNLTKRLLHNATTEIATKNATILSLTQNITQKVSDLATMTTNYNTKSAALNVALTNITQLQAVIATLQGQRVVNKSYAEFKAFYRGDKTNNHSGMNGSYTAENYACDFKINATRSYIRCAFVIVSRNNSTTSYINEVNTTTNGTIYLDPKTDTEVAAPVVGHIFDGFIVTKILRVW